VILRLAQPDHHRTIAREISQVGDATWDAIIASRDQATDQPLGLVSCVARLGVRMDLQKFGETVESFVKRFGTPAIDRHSSITEATGGGSAWTPFRYTAFTVLWLATVLSNIGSWMQNAAAGWLMTSLNPDPFRVALVQAASTLPMFLFSVPAGALADIIDRRRLLIAVQIAAAALAALFAIVVWLDWATSDRLLTFILLSGITTILTAPAWQAIVPQLVSKKELSAAVALNGVGFNVSRAIGPAFAGLAIAALGMAAPFLFNALSTLGVIAALVWWRGVGSISQSLPAERFINAIRNGLRYARYNPDLRATLIRSAGFFPLASVYWALLPLLARDQIGGGPELYGVLLGTIGAGAVIGAFGLRAKARLGADGMIVAATIVTALALALFAAAREPAIALIACMLAGISWIAVIATLNVSAQLALPAWVRGRGLAIFATVQFAGLAVGSAVWGQAAQALGLPAAHIIAAIGLVALVPLLRHWKLRTGDALDLAPSMHWPAPVLSADVEPDRGPVLVTVEYVVAPIARPPFLVAMAKLASERRRDGAYDWNIYEDAAKEGVFIEAFQVDSWLEHLRQHERVTNSDRVLQDAVHSFTAGGMPVVRHLIAARGSERA
jgi:MFS family permease